MQPMKTKQMDAPTRTIRRILALIMGHFEVLQQSSEMALPTPPHPHKRLVERYTRHNSSWFLIFLKLSVNEIFSFIYGSHIWKKDAVVNANRI